MDKKLGFGCMRLPMNGSEVNYDEFNKMIDYFIKSGFNYFDTAHGYIRGESEKAIKKCLTSRYDRDQYILTNKLTQSYFNSREEIRPLFEKQLEICGVEYFDYYLMHSQDKEGYAHFQKCHAYEEAYSFKKEGKIKHFGISFHDTAEMLDKILTEHPEVEIVQIQFNYIDYYSQSVQGKEVYEVARKHGKDILIMEPVKGGKLVDLPEDAKKVFDDLGNDAYSYANYALRFAASFDGVFKVLSGMSNFDQLKDNVDAFIDFEPITEKELEAIDKVRHILDKLGGIACTACKYCIEGCPMHISIPDLFSCYNSKMQFHDWNANYYYSIHTIDGNKASTCIKCGKCESICPQHLPIRELLVKVSEEFEK